MNYEIMSVINDNPGNGHFIDVLEWFENSCKRDKKNLVFLEMMNDKFKERLIKQDGFEPYLKNDLIKTFKKIKKAANILAHYNETIPF